MNSILVTTPNDPLHGAVSELAWINNPLQNIEKAIELLKLRREVRLRTIPGQFTGDELNLLMLHKVEGLTPEQIAERIGEKTESIRYQLFMIATRVTKRNVFKLMPDTCSQPIVGRWINDCDYPFLTETLALTNVVFKQQFRGIQLSHEERKMMAKTLETHTRECARCGAKRAEDDKDKRDAEKLLFVETSGGVTQVVVLWQTNHN